MFSKKLALALCLPSLLIGLAGCAGEEEPFSVPPQVKLDGDDSQCLSKAPEIIDEFITGGLPDHKVIAFWDCFNDALSIFVDYTRGRQSDVYTAREIRTFLERFFLGDVKISDRLLNQVMQIKRLFVSGSVESFSKEDLVKVQAVIEDFKRLCLKLNPHVSLVYKALVGSTKDSPASPKDFNAAMEALHTVAKDLGGVLQISGEEYLFSDLQIFLEEIYYLIEGKNSNPQVWTKYIVLLERGKALLVGGDQGKIASVEWNHAFSAFSRFVRTVVRLQYFIFNKEFGTRISIEQVQLGFRDIHSVLVEALKFQKNENFSYADLDILIETFYNLFGLPMGLEVEDAQELLRVVVERFLSPYGSREESTVHGIGLIQLQTLKDEFNHWMDSQRYVVEIIESNDFNRTPTTPGAQELRKVALEAPWNLTLDHRGVLQFDWSEGERTYDLYSLTTLNWQRMAIRLLVNNYAGDLNRRENLIGLTEEELKVAQAELSPLLVAIGLISEGDTTLYTRVVREANLFMPRSDSNNVVSYYEGVEYLAFILSGLAMEEEIFSDLMREGCQTSEDAEGGTLVDVICFRDVAEKFKSKHLSHLPRMQTYFDAPVEGLWREFEKYQEKAVRTDGFSNSPISRGDIMEMWILLQYIETFYSRFDNEGPLGTINLNDSLSAYDVYRPYLKDLLSDYPLSKADRLALFTYMMKYGTIPYFEDGWGGLVRFVNWKLTKHKWKFEADRLKIVKILASLSSL